MYDECGVIAGTKTDPIKKLPHKNTCKAANIGWACWPAIRIALFGKPPALTPNKMNGRARKTIEGTVQKSGI